MNISDEPPKFTVEDYISRGPQSKVVQYS